MHKSIFVTGIGTDIGKTVASAVLCRALSRDYWKPVQAGNLEHTDSDFLASVCPSVKIHPESYRLTAPLSPHAAAAIDGVEISLEKIRIPDCSNSLVIEGAGGLMVPLNHKHLVIDLIRHLETPVILVSRNYLGSINHTLLSIEALLKREIPVLGVLFNGEENTQTESIITEMTKLPHLGRIPLVPEINTEFIHQQAAQARTTLQKHGLTSHGA